ncbi:MAG: hypothetical protein CMJ38_01315 [Phycisphaerae bacterium]|nr:hypothetical protein [Phycisphaerae bacterium]
MLPPIAMALMHRMSSLRPTQKAVVALCLLLPAPVIGILASLTLGQVGQFIWTLMKAWLIAMPVLWLLLIDREKLSWSPSSLKGIVVGALWSIPVGCSIWLLYSYCLESYIDKEGIREQIELFGLTTPVMFWSFAIMISFGNALMEEYVWRWFVYSKCKTVAGSMKGIVLAAFFFTAHHVIVIWNFGDVLIVAIGSVAIFFAGCLWCYLYETYQSIWPGYISHVVADLAVFTIAWGMLTS